MPLKVMLPLASRLRKLTGDCKISDLSSQNFTYCKLQKFAYPSGWYGRFD
jgi:hypothetical protein